MVDRVASIPRAWVAVGAGVVALVVVAAIVVTSGILWKTGGRTPLPGDTRQPLSIAVSAGGRLAVSPRTIDAGPYPILLRNASADYWMVTLVKVESDQDVQRLVAGDHQGFTFGVFESLEPGLPPTAGRIEIEPGRYAIYIQLVEAEPAPGPQPIERRHLALVEVR